MSKKIEDDKLLKKLMEEIVEEAKKVVEDYVNNPSEESGSVVEVHIDSPLLENVSGSLGDIAISIKRKSKKTEEKD